MEASLKRRRELQSYTPVKRVYRYRSPRTMIPPNLTPNSHREAVRGLASIMSAAQLGSLPLVLHHLESRGFERAHDRYGPHHRTLLQIAARAGNLDLVRFLRSTLKLDVLATDDSGATALSLSKTDSVRDYLHREALWESRKALVFCYDLRIPFLCRLPEEVFRSLFAEGIV